MQPIPRTVVQVARGLTYGNRALLLEDLSPATIVLTEPTDGTVRHLRTSAFLDTWWDVHASGPSGADGATSRAVLTILDGEINHAGDVILAVRDPRICGSGLLWTVDVVDGVVPPRAGSCLLCVTMDGAEVPA